MAGDYTRFTFDPIKGFSGVLKQQGRVSLDSDANEFEEILDRRDRAEMYDTVGQAVYPLTTPHAFEIAVDAVSGKLTIGQGRLYVDGILAECFGNMTDPANTNFDEHMNDLVGKDPLLYDQQPFFYSTPPFPALSPIPGWINLIYLDVWQREVTVFEEYALREIALNGPDTDTRVQAAWQVKVMKDRADAGSCATPPAAWKTLIAPSTARLTAAATPAAPAPGPCVINPASGYTGLENRLYRVEIHSAGTVDGVTKAKFKWSRDNASLAARVLSTTKIAATDWIITVGSTGRDSWMRFEFGDHVELLDDNVEFAMRESGTGGIMAKVTSVNHATGEIHVDQDLTAFPIVAGRHARIRRWDIASAAEPFVRDTNNGVAIALENGISITFGPSAADTLHAGDHWVFAARTADGSIDSLVQQAPRNILHHFAPLALVTSGKPPMLLSDCRHPWPPRGEGAGRDCSCTQCVTPQLHASGELTIQMAIDQVIAAHGGTVCLEVGNYALRAPVKIEGASSVKLVGKGTASQLVAIEATSAVLVNKSQDIVLDSFSVLCRGPITAPQEAVSVAVSRSVRVEHLAIQVESEDPQWAAIGLAGALMDLNLRDNALVAPTGIRSGSDPTGGGAAGLADVRIENNDFECAVTAIAFAPVTVHQFVNRICGNRVNGCQETGFLLTGMTAPGFGLEVQANVFSVLGHGILASLNGLRVLDNDILQVKGATPKQHGGIFLAPGPTAGNPITDCQIIGNRIQGFDGAGIVVTALLRTVMIKQNQIAQVKVGLLLESGGVIDQLSIENNQFNGITGTAILAKGGVARYAATGNQIHTTSQESAVLLEFADGDGHGVFSEGVVSHNECHRIGDGNAADVRLQSKTLIVSNNRVVGGGFSLHIQAAQGHYAVLGNICSGKIIVEPSPGLVAPWAALNLEGVV